MAYAAAFQGEDYHDIPQKCIDESYEEGFVMWNTMSIVPLITPYEPHTISKFQDVAVKGGKFLFDCVLSTTSVKKGKPETQKPGIKGQLFTWHSYLIDTLNERQTATYSLESIPKFRNPSCKVEEISEQANLASRRGQ